MRPRGAWHARAVPLPPCVYGNVFCSARLKHNSNMAGKSSTVVIMTFSSGFEGWNLGTGN
eukprot:202934-Prymnesium_polylepis.1